MRKAKSPDYLDFCARFIWGLPAGLDRTPLDSADYRPECCGVIVADGYDAEILRPAPLQPLAAARRKVEIERLARAAMRRHAQVLDPPLASLPPIDQDRKSTPRNPVTNAHLVCRHLLAKKTK